jgi:GH43 family beta-xylosidase
MACVRLLAIILLCSSIARADPPPPPPPAAATFANPIITSTDAPDPWVIRHDGWYYFTATFEPDGGIWVWRSRTLSGLDRGEKVKVWTAPKSGPQSRQIWAPELYRFNERWYLYYTASDGDERNHRHYVLESVADDPLGEYLDRGRIDPELDAFAIDGSILRTPDGKLYWMYSSGALHIVPMISPTRVDASRRATIAKADLAWERTWIEAPQALVRDGRIFIVYSAGHSGTPNYALGLLAHGGGDVLDPKSWRKSSAPVFAPVFNEHGSVYTVGHNCFTESPDGTEDWILYHGKQWTHEDKMGFGNRKTRMQRFTWRPDGTPDFGQPIPAGVPIALPAGEDEK